MRTADDLSASLKRVPGLLPGRVSIVHETDRSVVTYGPYPPAYRPQGGFDITPEIRRDLNLIRSLAINEQFPFLTAAIRPSPTPDSGPPEWNLRNAPGVYSLQIGIFFNAGQFLERKQAAVEWVRDLRQRGFPAYYHHDNTKGRSIVTVGAFDESAVIAGRGVARNRRERDYSPSPRDYSQEVIELQHKSSEFRYNHENGAEVKANGIPQASFLVSIPHVSRDEAIP